MTDLKNITYNSDSSQEEWTNVLARAIELTSVYYGLLLVVMGCVCNPLSFTVLSRKSFRSSNLSLHLRILSASDLASLLNMFFNIFIERVYDVDLNGNKVGCQVSVFFGHLSLFLSSWILVTVTVERVMFTYKPHRYQIMCSKAVAKGVLATTIVSLSLISLLPTLTYDGGVVIDPTTNTSTELHCQKHRANSAGQSIMIMLLFALLPSLFLVVLNIFIIVGVVRIGKSVMRRSNAIVDRSSNETTGTPRPRQWKTSQRSGRDHISKREAYLTKTVLAVNITFIFCNFPVCVFGASLRLMADDMGVLGVAVFDLLLMFVYTNNAMNFVLYCVTGAKFRSEVRAFFNDIFHCRCPI